MTAATLSRLPLAAGGTLLGSLGRGGFWALSRLLDLGFWSSAQFMRAPLPISTAAVVIGFSLAAGSNALYFQHGKHPAPLFFSAPRAESPARPAIIAPVLPAPRPRSEPRVDAETTGSIAVPSAPTVVAPPVIASTDITAMQMKLVAMKLLEGTPDGIFGPRTAAAVRAFQIGAHLRPDGKLSPAVLAAIRNAPLPVANAPAPIAAAPASLATAAPAGPVPLAPLPVASTPVAPRTAPAQPSGAAPQAAITGAAALPAADTFDANASADVAAQPAVPQSQPLAAPPPAAAPVRAAAAPAPAGTGNAAMPVPSAAQQFAAQMGTLPPANSAQNMMPESMGDENLQGSTDPALIARIQRGLASLGFLYDKIDGVPGEGTAKAIRNFEVFYNYKVTGLATPQLLNLLIQHGATI